ncbi:MAG TPA: glycosyltransferase [Xanthobacteraceae bacterium]|nr:glycosyltransferase [Xanthobacteraceae bacterium]
MSNSRVYFGRLSRDDRWRKSVALVYLVLTLVYLGWRTTIINVDALGLSVIYFIAELLGFLLGLTLIFCSWNYRHREVPPAPRGLKVDVFIPAYREPAELVRWTIIAAQKITYPHETFLLDDGNRADLKALAKELGVHYLARERNLNAKAGNLNHGLKHSQAEFVMVLDADHIATPRALDMTLGFFGDDRVAMVQTPQDYYNTDAFQFINARNGALWHDQSFFYNIAQASRDSFNGASCVGTGVVYRRSALDAIGGIPTETVTEDFHTSLRLHKAGFNVVYLNEPIAYGVAASDLREYYKTRHRWAHGNIHALRIEKIFTCSGLSLGQRLSYLTLGLIYLEGWQQLLLFFVPWISLLMGWAPFDITAFNVLAVLLFPILTTLLLQELGCGLSRYWVNEIFSVARFPTHILAALALFSDKMRFRTSTKNIRGRMEWRPLFPQLFVCAVSLAALGVGVFHLAIDFRIGPLAHDFLNIFSGNFGEVNWNQRLDQGYTLELVAISGFWALFNAAKCLYLVHKAIRDSRRSTDDYRFHVRVPLEIETGNGLGTACVERISQSWASARWCDGDPPPVGERLKGWLHLPAGVIAVDCVVVARVRPKIWKRKVGPLAIEISRSGEAAEGMRVDFELLWPNAQARRHLAESLYAVDWHREFMHRHAFFATPRQAIARFLRLRRPFAQNIAWRPAIYRVPETGDLAYAVVDTGGGNSFTRLIAFRVMHPGQTINLRVLGNGRVFARCLRIIGRDSLRSLATKGLDGAIVQSYKAIPDERSAGFAQPLVVAAE